MKPTENRLSSSQLREVWQAPNLSIQSFFRASGIIENFASHERRIYKFQEKSINLDKIRIAMLGRAEGAGGERAKRLCR